MMLLLAGSLILPSQSNAFTLPVDSVVIVAQTQLYNDHTGSSKAIGALSPLQTVKVVGRDIPVDSMEDASWLKVSTWLGDKWIKIDDRIQSGSFLKEEQSMTSVFEEPLYNYPDEGAKSRYSLSPQKLHVQAKLIYRPLSYSNATEVVSTSETVWYRVQTWLGEKWVLNPSVLENVVEEQVSFRIKLTGEETVYPSPFVVEKQAETIPTQALSVIAKWETGFGLSSLTWYKVNLQDGPRWLLPTHEVIYSFVETDERIELPTQTRYFAHPQAMADDDNWLGPGTYQAFETSNEEWKHIKLPQGGDAWINPSRALLERPIGIEQADEQIAITKDTETFRYPLTGEVFHRRGFYAPQTVRAYEKWTSEEGVIWYHIHGFGGDEWLMQPPQ